MYCPVCRSEYPADWRRCPKDEAALLRENKVGKYRIDEVIGVGGMGAVYRAFNPDTQSAVAIKLMHAQAASNDAARTRFQREAAAVAALRTRHVVTIYDFGAETDGTLYLVMEFLVGHTLRAEIQGPPALLPLPRVNALVDGALRGLGAAHRAGVTHRDLKPENVFIATTDDGEVTKILDFGIARVSSKDAALTQSGALMGTPAYMAPEQVAGNRGAVGPWTDVYSMGVILYEALTGSSPFAADTITEVLGRVLGRQFQPLREVRPDVPPAIAAVVERAMEDGPDQRFPNADALREAWVVANGGTPATPTEPSAAGKGRRALGAIAIDPTHDATAPTVAPTQTATQAPTITPVIETATAPDAGAKGRAGIWIALAVVAAGGVTVAILLARGGGGAARPAATIDAAVAIVTPPVADAKATAPIAFDAAADVDMARFEGGNFTMGTDPKVGPPASSDPLHDVTVAPFLLDKREVSLAAFHAAIADPAAGGLAGDHPDWPARSITAGEAAAACKAMGKRLPTEAEWDLVSLGAPSDVSGARLRTAGADAPDPVGSHADDCTPDGVCDLIGNVMEWTSDDWTRPHPRAGKRVVRGASYRVEASETFYGSVHARVAVAPDERDKEIGFRCAKDATPPGATGP